jgi:hypothetical protein
MAYHELVGNNSVTKRIQSNKQYHLTNKTDSQTSQSQILPNYT